MPDRNRGRWRPSMHCVDRRLTPWCLPLVSVQARTSPATTFIMLSAIKHTRTSLNRCLPANELPCPTLKSSNNLDPDAFPLPVARMPIATLTISRFRRLVRLRPLLPPRSIPCPKLLTKSERTTPADKLHAVSVFNVKKSSKSKALRPDRMNRCALKKHFRSNLHSSLLWLHRPSGLCPRMRYPTWAADCPVLVLRQVFQQRR